MKRPVEAVIVSPGDEPGAYNVLPIGSASAALSSAVPAYSILKEVFTTGQKVTIIEVSGEYGICSVSAGMRGLLSLRGNSKDAAILSNPAMAACSYIGNLAGNIIKPYWTGKVTAINGAYLAVKNLITNITSSLKVGIGLSAALFTVDDTVLVNNFEYKAPIVCGWWKTSGIVAFNLIRNYYATSGSAGTCSAFTPTGGISGSSSELVRYFSYLNGYTYAEETEPGVFIPMTFGIYAASATVLSYRFEMTPVESASVPDWPLWCKFFRKDIEHETDWFVVEKIDGKWTISECAESSIQTTIEAMHEIRFSRNKPED